MASEQDQTGAECFAEAAQRPQRGVIGELVGFVRDNKRWILVPILVVLVLVGVLVALASTAAAPLIYPLF